uniref:BtpA family membrane complex biogenesis protein n=1 Tax=Arion vulgaris TaxID=1028688 RepID=A0A0B6Z9V4_9EUPU
MCEPLQDGVMLENMHDVPYLHTSQVGPEVTSVMSIVCYEVKRIFSHAPVGVQVLAGANKEALAVAKAAGLQFIRAEGFVFSHVADEGLMNACSGELMRYRKYIGAEDIMVFTDIKKKHSSHAITSDVDIVSTAQASEFFLSDGVIVTGGATGHAANISEVKAVLGGVHIPVLVGSGVTQENYHHYRQAHGLIVGSYFKRNGSWDEEIDRSRVKAFMENVSKVRHIPVESTMIM